MYGKAEFQPGMEEVEVDPITSTSSIDAPASTTFVIPVVGSPITDDVASESYSMLQKGLFFAVILGCVAFYLRINNKRGKRYEDKSNA